jgi:phage shock protein C
MTRYNPNRLYRDMRNAKVMGVCAGIADYFDIKVGVIRFLAILALIFTGGWAIVPYVLMGFMLDKKPEGLYERPLEDEFWRTARTKPDYTSADLRRRYDEVERRTRDLEAYITSKRFRLDRELRGLED